MTQDERNQAHQQLAKRYADAVKDLADAECERDYLIDQARRVRDVKVPETRASVERAWADLLAVQGAIAAGWGLREALETPVKVRQ